MYIHYQERIELRKGRYILVVNYIEPLAKFGFDEIITQSLLNAMNTSDAWQDNGYCCITGAPLEHRILKVIADDNYNVENVDLIPCPSDDELLKQYNEYKKESTL